MAVHLGQHLMSLMDQLRVEPVTKRIRASHASTPVCETTDAMLVWEPRRVVPMYAVPEADVRVPLTPIETPAPPPDLPPVLGPVNFAWHFQEGQAYTVSVPGADLVGAAFRPADPDLGGRVILDWWPFEWMEEDQSVTGHPHDPFKRIDVLSSGRRIVVAYDGTVLADTTGAIALHETHIPARWYVPRDDVDLDLLEPSATTSVCAYKGHATYFSLADGPAGTEDFAWTYLDPLPEVAVVRGHVCFYAERTDLVVDGVAVPRPRTPWSSREAAELF